MRKSLNDLVKGLLFLKKKKQKDFRSCRRWHHPTQRPQDQKFFGYFFSKM